MQPGTRYLDIGCGAGMATQMASTLGAEVVGIDASEALLAIARERTPGGDFRVGDVEALPFADRSFDVVTGFNSLQYAGNPGVALAEARRVAEPEGRVVVATWGEPDGMPAASVVTALRHLLPPPPPGAPGPFALSDETVLRKFAEDAELDPIEIFDVDSSFHYADLDIGPASAQFHRCGGARNGEFERGGGQPGASGSIGPLPPGGWQLSCCGSLPLLARTALILGIKNVRFCSDP